MKAWARISIFLALGAATSWGDSIIQSRMEQTLSTALNYDSRSVFLNPAALGYQTELNGAGLSSSFAYGWNRATSDEYAFSLAYGYAGFGAEQLSLDQGSFSRYRFSLGFPLTSFFYLGARYSFTSSPNLTLNGLHTWDVAAQVRPAPWLSLGIVANNISQAAATAAVSYPAAYSFSSAVRPFHWLTLMADASSNASALMVQLDMVKGISLRAGYHSEFQWQGGLTINLDHVAVFSESQAGNTALAGFQIAGMPYPSILQPDTALKVDISPSLSEQPVRAGLLSKGQPSSLELLRTLEEASHNDRVSAVLVRLDHFPLGLAVAAEIQESLLKLREQGKQVEVYLGDAGLKEYLIASGASQIYLAPTGEIRFPGLKSERYFLKGTLTKVGIEAEFLAEGEYKSAPEMFTREESSPAHRTATLSLLTEAEKQVLRRLEKGRKIDATRWKFLLGTASFNAEQAMQAGLIDGTAHFSEAIMAIKKTRLVRETLAERRDDLSLPPRIAVVVAEGDILDSRADWMDLGGYKAITPERIEKQLKRVMSDARTEAVILRVSSPGGEILASDRIASLLQTAAKKKPLFVSMGDVAASGGYYIAMPGKKVFASDLSITGSIGVFLGKFNMAGLYKWLELKKEILGDIAYPGIFSEDRPWSLKEKEILRKRLDQYYQGFVSYVALNRHLSEKNAEAAARGRVWLGSEARGLGLTDGSEGYLGVVDRIAKEKDWDFADYEPWVLGEERGLFSFFLDEDAAKTLSAWKTFSYSVFSEGLLRQLRWMPHFKETPFLYLSPTMSLE